MSNNQDLNLKFIDLGLPSGTCWASANTDAETVEDSGIIASIGSIENLLQKEEEYRRIIPTKEQFAELFNREFTTLERLESENSWGYKITSKFNGKSIFLPIGEVWINQFGVKFLEQGAYATSSYFYSKPLEEQENQVLHVSNMLYFISEYRAHEDNVNPNHLCMVRFVSKKSKQ